jgi:ATP-dependent Lon protease
VGMTGEITLRGQVLPVGGIKEKVLAAHRSGLKTVILPVRNEPDLDDLPEEVRQAMNFVFAETVDDVLEAALDPAIEPPPDEASPAADAPAAEEPEQETSEVAA